MLCLMCDGGNNSGEMPMLNSERALPGRGWISTSCTVLGKASDSAIHHLLEAQGIPALQEEEH